VKKKNIYILIAVIAGLLIFYFYPHSKGYIKIDTSNFGGIISSVDMLLSRGLFQNVRINSSVEATVGTYKPKNIFIRSLKDKSTSYTFIATSGPWGQLSPIKVEKDKITTISLGPPFTIKTNVQKNKNIVSIGLSLMGCSGEYWNPQVSLNKGQVMAPKISIVDEAGKTLASGNFQFG
jgi:hypothetical protein